MVVSLSLCSVSPQFSLSVSTVVLNAALTVTGEIEYERS